MNALIAIAKVAAVCAITWLIAGCFFLGLGMLCGCFIRGCSTALTLTR